MAERRSLADLGFPSLPGPRLSELVSNAIQTARSGITAPYDAFSKGLSSDDMVKRAMDFAMTVGGMGSMIPKPGNSLGIFGGKLAKTADLDKLAQAEKFEKAGVNPDMIWKATGWGKGSDGRWRFEIPDQKAAFKPGEIPAVPKNTNEVFDHPELYAAYPELAMGLVKKTGPRAKFNGANYGNNVIGINPKISDPRSTMLHELQHSVQDIEGFAKGADTGSAKSIVTQAMVRKGMSLQEAKKIVAKLKDKYQVYKHTAGETEARSVQKRKDYNDLLRGLRSPWQDEDVPRNLQLPFGYK
jgi:polyhydroxyalkanoate synthesis regulator phasin